MLFGTRAVQALLNQGWDPILLAVVLAPMILILTCAVQEQFNEGRDFVLFAVVLVPMMLFPVHAAMVKLDTAWGAPNFERYSWDAGLYCCCIIIIIQVWSTSLIIVNQQKNYYSLATRSELASLTHSFTPTTRLASKGLLL